MELDVYWVAYAGVAPVSYLQTLADRVALIHLKDMAADRSMTEVGKGVLDMRPICEFAQARGLWGIVEHDHPQIPSLESAVISFEYFSYMPWTLLLNPGIHHTAPTRLPSSQHF